MKIKLPARSGLLAWVLQGGGRMDGEQGRSGLRVLRRLAERKFDFHECLAETGRTSRGGRLR